MPVFYISSSALVTDDRFGRKSYLCWSPAAGSGYALTFQRFRLFTRSSYLSRISYLVTRAQIHMYSCIDNVRIMLCLRIVARMIRSATGMPCGLRRTLILKRASAQHSPTLTMLACARNKKFRWSCRAPSSTLAATNIVQ